MVCKGTAKAEIVATVAVYGGYDVTELASLDTTIDSVNAVGGWAPLEIVLVVDVRPSE